jgi:hypothetical protein
MDAAGVLMTIAQIAMALTGFAGLLIAFRFNKRKWRRVEVHAVRFMFKSSVGAFVLALAPLPLIMGGVPGDAFWPPCFVALGCWMLWMVGKAFRDRFRGDLRPRYEIGFWGLSLSGLLIGILQIGAAADSVGLRQPAIYVLGLYWLLAVAIFQLIMQILASLESIDCE